MMITVSLRADCAHCAGLCCIALAFDKSESFACDKPAGVPCANLMADNRCAIHAERAARGFGGCLSYDCHGAGQRVTQEVFKARTWREEPAILAPMIRAFITMQEIHRLLALLEEAHKLPLLPADRNELHQFLKALQPPGGWTTASLAAFDQSGTDQEVRAFLKSLRRYVMTPRRAAG